MPISKVLQYIPIRLAVNIYISLHRVYTQYIQGGTNTSYVHVVRVVVDVRA